MMDKKGVLDLNYHKIIKCTQTESNGAQYCESCDVACSLVKSLIYNVRSIVNKYHIDSDIEKQIVIIQSSIYEISQWTAMQEWSQALLKDMQKICDLINDTQSAKAALQKQVADKDNALNDSDLKYQTLLKDTSRRSKKDEAKYESLHKSKNELQQKNAYLIEANVKLEKLLSEAKKKLDASEENMKQIVNNCDAGGIKEENAKLLTELSDLQSSVANEQNAVKELSGQVVRLMKEQEFAKQRFDSELSRLNKLLAEKTEQIDLLQNSLEDLKGANLGLEQSLAAEQGKVAGLEKSLKTVEDRGQELKLKIEKIHENENVPHSSIKLSGNPLEDMREQLRVNEAQVQALAQKNDTLRLTIEKLSKILPNY